MSILQGLPTKRRAHIAPSPPGLRPGRSSAALPSSTISTYCLRRAPCIRSVLATTHHAPTIEIGSDPLVLFRGHISEPGELNPGTRYFVASATRPRNSTWTEFY